MSGFGVCFICQKVDAVDEHHVIPQAAGGTEGPVVDLCPSCHSKLHRQTVNLLSKKAKRQQYFSQQELERAKPLITSIFVHLRQLKENRPDHLPVKVMLELSQRDLMMLHLHKMDKNYSSVQTFIAAILQDWLRKN